MNWAKKSKKRTHGFASLQTQTHTRQRCCFHRKIMFWNIRRNCFLKAHWCFTAHFAITNDFYSLEDRGCRFWISEWEALFTASVVNMDRGNGEEGETDSADDLTENSTADHTNQEKRKHGKSSALRTFKRRAAGSREPSADRETEPQPSQTCKPGWVLDWLIWLIYLFSQHCFFVSFFCLGLVR